MMHNLPLLSLSNVLRQRPSYGMDTPVIDVLNVEMTGGGEEVQIAACR